MKNILVTGASGFIGSFLTEYGLESGYNVFAAIRSSSSKKYLQDERINFVNINLSDKSSLIATFKKYKKEVGGFDYVIHNAGLTRAVAKNDFLKVNRDFTQNLVEALIESDCVPQKFIYMSSLAAYGPGDETTNAPVKISDEPKPLTLYGKSKLAAEKYIFSLEDFPFLIIRPTAVYGPREKDYLSYFKTIKSNLELYIGSPAQLLTFIYVKDLVRLIYISMESEITNKSYFITDGKDYEGVEFAAISKAILSKKTLKVTVPKSLFKTIATLSEKYGTLFNKSMLLNTEKYKELTSLNWRCDASDLARDFGFEAEYDLQKGVEETIDWYKKNNWL